MSDVGRNEPCPCFSGKKYENKSFAHISFSRVQVEEHTIFPAAFARFLKE
jgi:hypothetical protein